MSTLPRGRTMAMPVSLSQRLALVVTILGVAVSTYLTIEHYDSSVTFACPETATINCQKVTTSSYSAIAGVPVAVLGLVFFVAMTILLLLPSRGAAPLARTVRVLRAVGASVGVLMVLWLVYVELFEVDAICLWCTAVHVLTVVLFAAVLWDQLGSDADEHPERPARRP